MALRRRRPPCCRWSTHFAILMIGQMLNLIIPIRIGEVARLGLMRQEGHPVGRHLRHDRRRENARPARSRLNRACCAPPRPDSFVVPPRSGRSRLAARRRPISRFARTGSARATHRESAHTYSTAAWGASRSGIQLGYARGRGHAGDNGGLRGRQLVRVSALTAAVWLLSLANRTDHAC